MKQGLMVLVNIKNEIVKQLEIFGKVIKDEKFILSYKDDRVRVDDKKKKGNKYKWILYIQGRGLVH